VPFLGLSWWTLDMPFVRRHSREAIQKNPALRSQDLESARRACEKFKGIPVAMTCFPEGTRFSREKRDRLGSPYRHLLAPKVGALAQVLYSLGDELHSLVDITVVYPDANARGRTPSFWDLMTGSVPEVVISAKLRPLDPALLGRNYREEPEFRKELTDWMNQLWEEKDREISRLLADRGNTGQD
jgi:1-acyl-sn-glycerol-3-phosphate acyltransferase